jgi:hypothetical protein
MLGDLISEEKGKITSQRVLDVEGVDRAQMILARQIFIFNRTLHRKFLRMDQTFHSWKWEDQER